MAPMRIVDPSYPYSINRFCKPDDARFILTLFCLSVSPSQFWSCSKKTGNNRYILDFKVSKGLLVKMALSEVALLAPMVIKKKIRKQKEL